MSIYPNPAALRLRESLKFGTVLVLALLWACDSSESNSDMNVDENVLADMDMNAIDVNAPMDDSANNTVSEPTCASKPPNGAILTDRRPSTTGHVLQIDNGTEGDAIIKVRNAATDRTLASFFVERGAKAALQGIPDGTYRIQYMIGDKLAADCRSFIHDGFASASEFPDAETLSTEYEDGEVRLSRLSYTLYAVPSGNVEPKSIDSANFDKP